jgi:hypothetical protein
MKKLLTIIVAVVFATKALCTETQLVKTNNIDGKNILSLQEGVLVIKNIESGKVIKLDKNGNLSPAPGNDMSFLLQGKSPFPFALYCNDSDISFYRSAQLSNFGGAYGIKSSGTFKFKSGVPASSEISGMAVVRNVVLIDSNFKITVPGSDKVLTWE